MNEQIPEGKNVGWSALLGAIETANVYASGPDELRIVTLRMDAALQLREELSKLRDALAWYEGQAKFMQRCTLHQDTKEMMETMKVLALDGGKKARAALTPNAELSRVAAQEKP